MNAKTLYVLIAAAVVAVGAAIGLHDWRQPKTEFDEQAKPLLPTLRDHVNDVSGVKLTGAGGKVIATLSRNKDGWGIAERAGYPADVTKLRDFLIRLDRATLIEPKTDNPKRYSDIGVGDVKDAQAKGVLVELSGLSGPVALIVGDYSAPSGGTFVRRDGEASSWLASGSLIPVKTVTDWEQRELVDIAPNRIASIVLRSPDGKTLTMSKRQQNDPNFDIADIPKGREANPGVAAMLSASLSGMKIDDVASAKDQPVPAQGYNAKYVTFDGVTINATGWTKDGKDYVQLSAALDQAIADAWVGQEQAKAAYDAAAQAAHSASTPAKSNDTHSDQEAAEAAPKPLAVSDPSKDRKDRLDAANKEVVALNKNFSGWTFVVPNSTFSNMSKNMNDVLKPLDVKKPAAANGKSANVSADAIFGPKPR